MDVHVPESKVKDLKKIQCEEAEVPSPNTRRRLKLHLSKPKFHINIPFLRHSHGHHGSGHDSPEIDIHYPEDLTHSLPSESHMPSNLRDLYHECGQCNQESDESEEDKGSNEELFVLETVPEAENEPESEKHQSDLEESEKESQKHVKFQDKVEKAPSASSADEASDSSAGKDAKSSAKTDASRCCLKPCLKKACMGRPRASTYPGPVDCLEASFKPHVSFSPDTVEPRTRNCKYREWIEQKCPHSKCPPVNIKHEKRKCQLEQMRKVNLSDYMSRNYGGSFFSPVATFGADMLL